MDLTTKEIQELQRSEFTVFCQPPIEMPVSLSTLLLLQIILYPTNGQQPGTNTSYTRGFMPGSSPATPNRALQICQRRTRPRPFNVTYEGKYGQDIYTWCSTYNDVLPCLDRTLPPSNDISDWFLKLVLERTRAFRMSRSMCARFPFISNLTCADEGMDRARQCMEWSTKTSIDQFYSQFKPGQPLTEINKRMASIYACITTVATAGCLHKQLTQCSLPQRKLIYDYYIMFSGQCRDIAGLPKPTVTSTTVKPQNPYSTTTVTDNIQLEDTKLNKALQSELDNKTSNANSISKDGTQNKNLERTTARNLPGKRQLSRDNGQASQYSVSFIFSLVSCLVVLSLM